MADDSKFKIKEGCLTVTSPFLLDDRQTEEEAFLSNVDTLVSQRSRDLVIDLVLAGSLSSTIIALTIAASRKAKDAGKTLKVCIARRNSFAIRISGLDKLVAVEFV